MDLLNIVHRFLILLVQRFVFDNTCIYKTYLTKKDNNRKNDCIFNKSVEMMFFLFLCLRYF